MKSTERIALFARFWNNTSRRGRTNSLAWFNRRYQIVGVIVWLARANNRKTPWEKAQANIRQRCSNPKAKGYEYYGGRGIKCLLSRRDLFNLYKRDRAWRLKEPSVDRKDPSKNYTVDNCRWIEMRENRELARAPVKT